MMDPVMKSPDIERLSAFATISRHERSIGIDRGLLRTKCREAAANARKREVLVLHRNGAEPLQRMLNALQPGSYIRPHRHGTPPKSETLVLLSGAAGFVVFEDDGAPDAASSVLLHPARGALAVDCRENVWHTFVALEPDTVLFESKAGPFDPGADREFAPWAPEEGSPEAPAYLQSLEREFRRASKL